MIQHMLNISNMKLENKTDFSFISSFGTQMDIVDKNDIDIEMIIKQFYKPLKHQE